ncbi:MAG: hypothetical protein WDN69_05205 [Aliidongia sp.]
MTPIRTKLALCCLSLCWLGLPLAAQAADSHATTMPGGPVYVRLKPISFSVIGADNRIDKEVSILLDLELEPEKTEPMLDPFKRKMMDAFLVELNEAYTEHKPDDPPVGGDAFEGQAARGCDQYCRARADPRRPDHVDRRTRPRPVGLFKDIRSAEWRAENGSARPDNCRLSRAARRPSCSAS